MAGLKLIKNSVHLSKKGHGLPALYASVQDDLQGACLEDIAYLSRRSVTTLRNWREGKTIAPRINTLTSVAQVLGYKITWLKS